MDILGINRNLTVRNNHYYDFPTSGYRVSSTTTNSLFENELIVDTDVGIQTNGFANTYRNMTILSCASRAFFDQNDNYEPVQYLTDDASVTWNLTRTTVNSPGEFGFGQLVNISSENINLTTGPTYSSLNDDMEMEFYNLAYTSVEFHQNGKQCDNDSSLCNLSYNSGTGIAYANASLLADYAIVEVAVTCDSISSDTVLTNDINVTMDCFTIAGSNVVLDGAGYSLIGSGAGTAISVTGFSNVTIFNFSNISTFQKGIYAENVAENLNITEVQIFNFTNDGIQLEDVNYSLLDKVTVYNNSNGEGLQLDNSSFNNVTNSSFIFVTRGIELTLDSDNNTFRNNYFNVISAQGIRILNDSSNNNVFENQTMFLAKWGYQTASSENNLINPYIRNSASNAYLDTEAELNDYILFNNTLGLISWNLSDTDVGGFDFYEGAGITLSQNLVGIDISFASTSLNDTAKIEIYNLSYQSILMRFKKQFCFYDFIITIIVYLFYSIGVLF